MRHHRRWLTSLGGLAILGAVCYTASSIVVGPVTTSGATTSDINSDVPDQPLPSPSVTTTAGPQPYPVPETLPTVPSTDIPQDEAAIIAFAKSKNFNYSGATFGSHEAVTSSLNSTVLGDRVTVKFASPIQYSGSIPVYTVAEGGTAVTYSTMNVNFNGATNLGLTVRLSDHTVVMVDDPNEKFTDAGGNDTAVMTYDNNNAN